MKKVSFLIVTIALLASWAQTSAQDALLVFDRKAPKQWHYSPRNIAGPAAFQFAAGFSKGVGDMLQFKYSQTIFPQQAGERFLGLNRQYFDPSISWKNKYWHGDPRNGEKFPFSSSVFVSLTDAWHMTDFVSTTSHQATAFAYRRPKNRGDTKNWKTFFIDFAIMKLAHSLGFYLAQRAVTK